MSEAKDGIHEALKEVFTADELAEMRRKVQYGECSFVTIVERPTRDSAVDLESERD